MRRNMETAAGHLRVRGRIDGDAARFTLDGDVDLTSGQAVRDAVCEALDEGARDIVLALSAAAFLGSTGLNSMLNTPPDVARRGPRLRCESPHGGEPRVVIDLAGVA